MIDQLMASSGPSVLGGARKLHGMGSSPLEHLLMQRHFSMNSAMHMPRMGVRMGIHENQPKVRPMSHGFRMPSLMR